MLQRNLRQDRYPTHAAEVRENFVPRKWLEQNPACNFRLSDLVVTHTVHACIDTMRPRATLFLHEDLVAKTLQFERELKAWRLTEMQAGRGDPGRPGYGYVFMTVCIFSRSSSIPK
jgi:hypothetical protein